jgi:hypothetical protein
VTYDLDLTAEETLPVEQARWLLTKPKSVNTALNFDFDLAGFDRLAAHTGMRRFQVRVAYAPAAPGTPYTLAAQLNIPTLISNVDLVRSRLFEWDYMISLHHELWRAGRLLVEGGVESWNAVETLTSGDYDDDNVCGVFTIEKS